MFYVVYIDVLFSVNAVMDFLVLALTGKALKKNTTFFRLFAAAVLGAACYCLYLVLPLKQMQVFSWTYFILISLGMVKLAFSVKGLKEEGRAVSTFFLVNFLTGGMINGIYHYTKLGYYIRKALKGEIKAQMTMGVLFLLAGFSWLILRYLIGKNQRRCCESASVYQVVFQMGDRTLEGTALLDTGNRLYEPISGKPVCMIESTAAKELFEDELWRAIESYYRTDEMKAEEWYRYPGIRMIPYSSVGKEKGILLAVPVERLYITKEGERRKITKPYVAVCPKAISAKGDYHILLHSELFTN